MIFNAKHFDWSWLPRIYCIRHGNYYAQEPIIHQWREIDEADMVYALKDIPEGAEVLHDVEGSLVPATLENWPALRLWHPKGDAPEAARRRLLMQRAQRMERPDIRHGFWPVDMAGDSFNALLTRADHIYIEAYPWPHETEAFWRDKLIRRIGQCYAYFGVRPRVLITDKTESVGWSAEEFSKRLDHVLSFGVDAVYWCMSSEVPSLGVKWALVSRSW